MQLSKGRLIAASALILLGLLFLVANLDIIDVDIDVWDFIGDWWPAILILLGVLGLARSRSAPTGNIVLIAVGAAFLLMNRGIVEGAVLWPVIIIGVGVWILVGGRKARRRKEDRKNEEGATSFTSLSDETDDNWIGVSAFFGSSEQRITSQALLGGTVSATFGSVILDLGGAMPVLDAALDVEVTMGSVELRAPDDWVVVVNGSPNFGSIEHSRPQPAETAGAPSLTVNASISFGSLEITSARR